jgi:hypothetical protein
VRRRQGPRMRIALPGIYSTRQLTIHLGLRRESRDDYREASVETIEGICSSVSPARMKHEATEERLADFQHYGCWRCHKRQVDLALA